MTVNLLLVWNLLMEHFHEIDVLSLFTNSGMLFLEISLVAYFKEMKPVVMKSLALNLNLLSLEL